VGHVTRIGEEIDICKMFIGYEKERETALKDVESDREL
jgi:hypothetical protein